MENFIIIAILLCIIGSILVYLYRAKKRGETCIGCPYARQCGGSCSGGQGGCGSYDDAGHVSCAGNDNGNGSCHDSFDEIKKEEQE